MEAEQLLRKVLRDAQLREPGFELTPPVGFPMFVMQTFTGRSLLYVSRAGLPFFFLLLLGTGLIVAFPGLVTYLPNRMMNR